MAEAKIERNGVHAQTANKKGRFYHVRLAILLSFFALPTTYIFNSLCGYVDGKNITIVMASTAVLLLISFVFIVAHMSSCTDWLYYGAALCCFTSIIDGIIVLEFNRVISDFMTFYLRRGEPYLFSPYGCAVALFDSVVFYIMYLTLIYLVTNRKGWKSLGIYWAGGLLNSMLVLLLAVTVGKYDTTYCTLLNLFYVVFPMAVLQRAFREKDEWHDKRSKNWFDWIQLAVVNIATVSCIILIFCKMLGLLAADFEYVEKILESEHTILWRDPAPFSIIQILLYNFYGMPMHLFWLWNSISSKRPKAVWYTTLILAGASLQGQFAFAVHAVDPQTPNYLKSSGYDPIFLTVNLLLAITPHLQLAKLYADHKMTEKVKKAV